MSSRRQLVLWAGIVVCFAVCSRIGVYRLRLLASQLLTATPDWAVPQHFTVLPPPSPEYVGIWGVTPAEARSKLRSEFGFRELLRAYFHSYERNGRIVHEVGSYVYRPDGLFGSHQLHVRLFPTPDGRTELWCHWERNPNRSPLSHLRRVGYDPAEGDRRLRELLADESLSLPDSDDLPPVVDP